MSLLRKSLLAATAGLALSTAGTAYAGPGVFTIDPSALAGSAEAAFQASFVNGNSTELLTASGSVLSGSGFTQFTGFTDPGGNSIDPPDSGLNVTYKLYITYTLSATLLTGTIGAPNSTYKLTQLDFTVFADPLANDIFSQAKA